MRTFLLLPLLAVSSLGSSGCVAGIAASAVGAAVRAAAPGPVTEDRRPAARTACEAQAAPHGQVRIIDAEQRADGRVTVWGRVENERQRRAFECRYDRRVTAFRLREIRP
ncbi:MAG TPA: hypothetical protein VF704_05725 [Allosphingosinicella sp.]|jgi:hypothetical protein